MTAIAFLVYLVGVGAAYGIITEITDTKSPAVLLSVLSWVAVVFIISAALAKAIVKISATIVNPANNRESKAKNTSEESVPAEGEIYFEEDQDYLYD